MKKYPYFPAGDGLACRVAEIPEQLKIIARRYTGANPPLPFSVRAVSDDFFRQEKDGAYQIDLAEKLGEGTDGYALVAGKLETPVPKEVYLTIACLGPCRLWLNGEVVFVSTFEDEIHIRQPHRLRVTLPKGSTVLLLLCRRTAAGFGCLLGLPPVTVCSALPQSEGAAGFHWTGLLPELTPAMTSGRLEDLLSLPWNPALLASEKPGSSASEDPRLSVSAEPGRSASTEPVPSSSAEPAPSSSVEPAPSPQVLWTRAAGIKNTPVTLQLSCRGPVECYINGVRAASFPDGPHSLTVPFHAPMDIHITGCCELKADAPLLSPVPVQGRTQPWLCAPLKPGEPFDYRRFTSLTNAPWRNIRIFYEGAFSDLWWVKTGNSSFGSWNYPMGVTLQGLLRMSEVTDSPDIREYVLRHMKQCLDHYDYACRDAETYGSTNMNPELTAHANLDQFGSMGAAMLACASYLSHPLTDRLAEEFFRFIQQRLPKLPDGTFCRRGNGPYDTDTIWADDLYMGSSFLIRFWKRYGAGEALEMAADQFLLYARRLMLPGNVLSHVYDLTRDLKTGIPWGRGNGWALFSLSELLEAMPEAHPKREALLTLFRQLSGGYAALQDANGYWHQVLTDASSYEETSCTAMFTYAMSKGLRHGWYPQPEPFLSCVRKGWNAISHYSVDKGGNVYAVCKGSGFSFTKEYYADDLFWIINDNHGVGIVLLAGSEVQLLLHPAGKPSS